jgi:uncharacterized membrane protein YdfJ with MMPL/SSD domain
MGPLGTAADSSDAFKGIDGTLLYAALAVVIVLLLVTYRSPALRLLPVICAGVALVGVQALIYLLARHVGLTVNAMSAGILNVLVFGAATDHALLLVARYQEERRRHVDRHEDMAVALCRAGPAIIASGGTVVLALGALVIAELNSTSGMGPAGHRRGRGPARHDHAAARAAGNRRPVDLLARTAPVDTIVVRSVLVTALNLDLGRRMWWPGRLGRAPHPEEGVAGREIQSTPDLSRSNNRLSG